MGGVTGLHLHTCGNQRTRPPSVSFAHPMSFPRRPVSFTLSASPITSALTARGLALDVRPLGAVRIRRRLMTTRTASSAAASSMDRFKCVDGFPVRRHYEPLATKVPQCCDAQIPVVKDLDPQRAP